MAGVTLAPFSNFAKENDDLKEKNAEHAAQLQTLGEQIKQLRSLVRERSE